MSLLGFRSDRSIKKLVDALPLYKDKLHEPEVFNRFQEILTKARANNSANKLGIELKDFEDVRNRSF